MGDKYQKIRDIFNDVLDRLMDYRMRDLSAIPSNKTIQEYEDEVLEELNLYRKRLEAQIEQIKWDEDRGDK